MEHASAYAIVADALEAIFDPDMTPRLLDTLADAMGGQSAWLARLDVRSGDGEGVISRIDPAMPELYRREFACKNRFALARDRTEYLRMWPRSIMSDDEVFPKTELVESDFYRGFLAPQDIHSTLTLRLGFRNETAISLKINRRAADGPFDARDRAQLGLVAPHLVRSFSLGEDLRAQGHLNRSLMVALASHSQAILILNARAALIYANPQGERMIASGRSLIHRAGVVVGATPRLDAELQRALTRAFRAGAEPPCSSDFAISPDPAERARRMTITPVPEPHRGFEAGGPLAIVSAAPTACVQPADTALAALTPAEARVADELARGASAREIAGRAGTSFHTVRAQVASVYRKLGVHRRAELARLLS